MATDLSGLGADSLALLGAPEVVAVDQDPLGVQGVRVSPAAAALLLPLLLLLLLLLPPPSSEGAAGVPQLKFGT